MLATKKLINLSTIKHYFTSLTHQLFSKQTIVWVDLDNVIGMVDIHHQELYPYLMKNLLPFLDQLGEPYDGVTEIKVYGNLYKHRIASLAGIHHLNNKVYLIDTPVIPSLGTTATDPIMMIDMVAAQDKLKHCLVVTSDVDFYPVCESMRQHNIGVDLLALGFISWRLKKSVDQRFDAKPYLYFLQSSTVTG